MALPWLYQTRQQSPRYNSRQGRASGIDNTGGEERTAQQQDSKKQEVHRRPNRGCDRGMVFGTPLAILNVTIILNNGAKRRYCLRWGGCSSTNVSGSMCGATSHGPPPTTPSGTQHTKQAQPRAQEGTGDTREGVVEQTRVMPKHKKEKAGPGMRHQPLATQVINESTILKPASSECCRSSGLGWISCWLRAI